MEFYELSSEDVRKLDLPGLSKEDLKELAYYLWCCFEEDDELMRWRSEVLLPLIKECDLSVEPEEESDDG